MSTTKAPECVEMWKLGKYGSLVPEKVRVLLISDQYWLEEGEEHTSYRGNFFPTAESAFDHLLRDCDEWIARQQRNKENILAARERFFSKGKEKAKR